MATIELKGLEQVKREMRNLAPRIQKNLLRGMTSAIAREVRNEAKKNAPRDVGDLSKNIIAKRRRGRRGVTRSSVIVRESGGRDDAQNAFYWRFVEFGHFSRDGSTFIPGSHFITRAFENVRQRIDQIITKYARPRIEKALRSR